VVRGLDPAYAQGFLLGNILPVGLAYWLTGFPDVGFE
jgi:hypothetical protein